MLLHVPTCMCISVYLTHSEGIVKFYTHRRLMRIVENLSECDV